MTETEQADTPAPSNGTEKPMGEERKGLSRYGRILLAASLMVNAFLVALVLAPWLTAPSHRGPGDGPAGVERRFDDRNGRHNRPPRGPAELHAIRIAVADGSEELQQMAQTLDEQVRADSEAARDRIRDARVEVIAAARAEPFDLDRFDVALADLRAIQTYRFTMMDRGLRDLIEQADPETRARFANALEEIGQRIERWRAERQRNRRERESEGGQR